MAMRGGNFRGGLNPFGTGSLGGFDQYNIAADLADLEVYRVEVAWGNGLATDDEYLAALRKALDATDPDTQRRESAQNKLDDGIYRIGRSKAEEQGLDALIAFDQQSLAKMNPSNVRYRDVQQSLRSEMAQRRSKQYGELVDSYNAGKTSTQALLTWVTNARKTISEDDPDFASWRDVEADLGERVKDEADAKVYQDYQQNRMSGAAFIAYLTKRRNEYDAGSPKYDEWSRKLEDASDNVRDKAQAEKDNSVFNRYAEGKLSSGFYLKYLRQRIAGMEPGDPDKAEWQHRLNEAAFSIAEDRLRYDVERGKAPVSRLVSFYRNYQRTLNPDSPEYRQIGRALRSLGSGSVSGGGGGGRRGSSSGGGGGGSAAGTSGALVTTTKETGQRSALDKLIDPRNTIKGSAPALFSINPLGSKKSIATAKKYLDLNLQNLGNAVRAGDHVWLFTDPRYPGQTVQGRNPDGSLMVDRNGKPVMVRGSAYLPASGEIYSNLKIVESNNWGAAAEVALARHKSGDYAYALKRAAESRDQAREADSRSRGQNWDEWYKHTSEAVDQLTQQGRYGEAVQLASLLASKLLDETRDPYLDQTRREQLDAIGKRLEDSPLITKVQTDPFTGEKRAAEGALDMTALRNGETKLNEGWHHVLKSKNGKADYGPVYDDRQDGTWEASHVTVHTTYGDSLVTGEVPVSKAPTAPVVVIDTPSGRQAQPAAIDADFISFVDENGHTVRAYSLDGGASWIKATAGMPAPVGEITRPMHEQQGRDGLELVDDETGEVAMTMGQNGWEWARSYDASKAVDWQGAAAYREARSALKPNYDASDREQSRIVQFERDRVSKFEVGGEGYHMQLSDASPSGVVNLTPGYEFDLRQRRGLDMEDRRATQFALTTTNAGAARFERDDWRKDLPSDTPPRFEGSGLRPGTSGYVNLPPTRPTYGPGSSGYQAVTPATPPALRRPTSTPALSKAKRATPPKPKPKPLPKPQRTVAAAKARHSVPKPPPLKPTRNTGGGGLGYNPAQLASPSTRGK